MQEDDHLHHHHLERPSVLEYEPVALRGEDGSDTGWKSTGDNRLYFNTRCSKTLSLFLNFPTLTHVYVYVWGSVCVIYIYMCLSGA